MLTFHMNRSLSPHFTAVREIIPMKNVKKLRFGCQVEIVGWNFNIGHKNMCGDCKLKLVTFFR